MQKQMNWDDLRYFLAVARQGQMLAAAKRLSVSQARLSRHIMTLESNLGVRLFDRTTRGSTLTKEGVDLFATAERIEGEILSGIADIEANEEISGIVRVGAPDGFGSAFLAPKLGKLRKLYPDLRVQLVPVPRHFSLSEREVDLAIMVGRPQKGRLRARKLVDYSLSLYAAHAYLQQAGMPTSASDLPQHTLVGYVDDLMYSAALNYAHEFLTDWRSDIEIATAIGQFEAIAAGVGIGICHDFMAAPCEALVCVLPELRVQRSYWIVWHEDLRKARRIQVFAAFMEQEIQAERHVFLRHFPEK